MNRHRGRRGAALMEFAMALPFALTLFIGIADFSVYFWRQTQMEEVARFTAAQIGPLATGYLAADEAGLQRYARLLESDAQAAFARKNLRIGLSRQYACPLPTGAEESLSPDPRGCPAERVYLRVTGDENLEPILRPLRAMGYPKSSFWRHVIRLR